MQQPSSPKQTLKKFKQSKLSDLHGQPPSLSSLSVFKFQKDPIILLNEEIVLHLKLIAQLQQTEIKGNMKIFYQPLKKSQMNRIISQILKS